ncbi:hypothetical protein DPMN_132232 [Dreissena polymorpha]|uniref:Uncharacterized protein n=1 Tax=Dreissena polymorpha TaxID=45954 RepID=A0A9D4J9W8_DREPO|nr:hypothetical protein DPMN_132232 [Dreissena polymorpha]
MKSVPIVLGGLMIVLLCLLVFQVIQSHSNISDSDILIPSIQSRRMSQPENSTNSKTYDVNNAPDTTKSLAGHRNQTDVVIQIHVLGDRG